MTKEVKTFEENLDRLEKIVNQLEQGDIPLEEALDKFQDGIELSRNLKKKLLDAEETLTKIVSEDGTEADFEINQ